MNIQKDTPMNFQAGNGREYLLPEHYPLVGECLLIAIKEVLQDAASDEVIEAWGKAYGAIADFYINIEAKIYQNT